MNDENLLELSERASDRRISTNSTPLEASSVVDDAEELVLYFRERFHGSITRGPLSRREIESARSFLNQCGGLTPAKSCVGWIRGKADWIDNFGGLLSNNYPQRALEALASGRTQAAEAAERRQRDDLRQRYEAWYRDEVTRRYEALDDKERSGLIATALDELRTGRHGSTFSSWPARTQGLIAERRVRGNLGRQLPALDEWANSTDPRSLTTEAA